MGSKALKNAYDQYGKSCWFICITNNMRTSDKWQKLRINGPTSFFVMPLTFTKYSGKYESHLNDTDKTLFNGDKNENGT